MGGGEEKGGGEGRWEREAGMEIRGHEKKGERNGAGEGAEWRGGEARGNGKGGRQGGKDVVQFHIKLWQLAADTFDKPG